MFKITYWNSIFKWFEYQNRCLAEITKLINFIIFSFLTVKKETVGMDYWKTREEGRTEGLGKRREVVL